MECLVFPYTLAVAGHTHVLSLVLLSHTSIFSLNEPKH